MEKDDKGSTMIRMGVNGWMFLLVPAYPGCPGSKAVKRSLLLLYSRSNRWRFSEAVPLLLCYNFDMNHVYACTTQPFGYGGIMFLGCPSICVCPDVYALTEAFLPSISNFCIFHYGIHKCSKFLPIKDTLIFYTISCWTLNKQVYIHCTEVF